MTKRTEMATNQITTRPFNLLGSFSALSLLSIAVISLLSAVLLARFLRENLLQRDAVITMEFVQSIAQAQNTHLYFTEKDYGKSKVALEDFFHRIAHMPDVARANVYSKDGTVIWSDQEHLIGQQFRDNPELERALAGELTSEIVGPADEKKPEQVFLSESVEQFIETYIPIREASGGSVVGAVELYKIPTTLLRTIEKGNRLVWINAGLGGTFLYGTLFWIVRRASFLIRRQQQALVESENLAIVGETASVVAHGIRNPLAAIRSSAELALEEASDPVKEYSVDIIREVDSLERSVRELLTYSRYQSDRSHTSSIRSVIQASLDSFARRLEKQHVNVTLMMPASLPVVRADASLLAQVINSLVSNAVEAMPNGGHLRVTAEVVGESVLVRLMDTGSGIPSDKLGEVFKPLTTYKRTGLGMGLFLAQRILQRYGASLEISSEQGTGTTALLRLPVMR